MQKPYKLFKRYCMTISFKNESLTFILTGELLVCSAQESDWRIGNVILL